MMVVVPVPWNWANTKPFGGLDPYIINIVNDRHIDMQIGSTLTSLLMDFNYRNQNVNNKLRKWITG